MAGILLTVFGGITDRLIPLFAIGAFLTFTMSQAGMVAHWRRELRAASRSRARHSARISLVINTVGAVTTGIALLVIIAAKFSEGAWITLLVIPCVILVLLMVNRYYAELDAQLREDGPIHLGRLDPPLVLVATEGWNRLTDRALQFALRLSPDVVAVHLVHLAGPDVDERKQALRRQWAEHVETPAKQAGLRPPQLMLLDAEYRRITGPLLKLIQTIERDYPNRLITVLIPEVVKDHWWQHLLHTHRSRRLRSALLHYASRLVVISIPWHLEEPRIEEGLEEQEIRETPVDKPKITQVAGS
jgi:hypothetical protein